MVPLFCHGSVSYISDCEFVCIASEYTFYLILRHSVTEQRIYEFEKVANILDTVRQIRAVKIAAEGKVVFRTL